MFLLTVWSLDLDFRFMVSDLRMEMAQGPDVIKRGTIIAAAYVVRFTAGTLSMCRVLKVPMPNGSTCRDMDLCILGKRDC